jgi:hypothetical protein
MKWRPCRRATLLTSAVLVFLLAEDEWLGTIVRPVSEASVVPAGGCCGVISGERSIVGATVPGAEWVILEAVVMVPGVKVVSLSAGSSHLAREFPDELQKRGVVS